MPECDCSMVIIRWTCRLGRARQCLSGASPLCSRRRRHCLLGRGARRIERYGSHSNARGNVGVLGAGLRGRRRERPPQSLSNLSLTTLLRGFEQGVFSSTATLGALIASSLLISVATIWLDLRTPMARKLVTSALAAVLAVVLAAGVAIRPLSIDTTEDARNSFPPADAATLAALDKPLQILVRLAPEDPRYIDFERKVLSKLRRSVRRIVVTPQSETRSGLFENSDSYGVVLYRYD